MEPEELVEGWLYQVLRGKQAGRQCWFKGFEDTELGRRAVIRYADKGTKGLARLEDLILVPGQIDIRIGHFIDVYLFGINNEVYEAKDGWCTMVISWLPSGAFLGKLIHVKHPRRDWPSGLTVPLLSHPDIDSLVKKKGKYDTGFAVLETLRDTLKPKDRSQ